MLAAILPGARDLRAPLAAGYLWLLGLWIALAPRLVAAAHRPGPLHDVYVLGQAAGRPADIAAVSFAAYLTGVVSTAANPAIARLGNLLAGVGLRRLMPRAQWDAIYATMTSIVHDRLDERFLTDPATRAETADRLGAAHQEATGLGLTLPTTVQGIPATVVEHSRSHPEIRRRILGALIDTESHEHECTKDLLLTPARLVGRENDIHVRYDRLRAEYELRMGLALPLTFLSAVLSVRASPWWAFLLTAAVALIYLGVAANIQAFTTLTESIEARRIQSTSLQDLATQPIHWNDPPTAARRLADR